MNKVFASILFVMCIMVGVFAQESKDILAKDPNYTEIEIVEGKVASWTDFEDGDQIQVKIDGKTYLVHSANIVLISE